MSRFLDENGQVVNKDELTLKLNYCLNCPTKPCTTKGCPLQNDIPTFIKILNQGKYEEAYKVLLRTTVLPAICGRICPHYKQCMGSCVRGIKGSPVEIGELEAFIGDLALKNNYSICNKKTKNFIQTPKNIAVIGGGPAGLTAAAFLRKSGNNVTIFEKHNYLGGLLAHGIPEFRLPKNVLQQTIKQIIDCGIEVRYNHELENNIKLSELELQYDYIILAFGANTAIKMGVKGEELHGVYSGNELLEFRQHPDYTGKTVLVCGGGNVAMDSARTIKKMGAKRVIIVYRRNRQQMPAEQKEIDNALNEGIEFLYQNNILQIIGDEQRCVKKVELVKTKLIQKEGTNFLPVNIDNSNYKLDADYVVMAIGSKPDKFVKNLGLEMDNYGKIKTNEFGQTSNKKIYAIGDIAGNVQTVAWAAKSGRIVAENINIKSHSFVI